jgi:capsular polysaccharide transport system ATP-binding protein
VSAVGIELIDVHKHYWIQGKLPLQRRRRPVLRGINAHIRRGEKLAVLGRNGAGKSTLVRLLGGVESPSHGYIRRDMSISWPLGQTAGFISTLTGLDNIRFLARLYGKPISEMVDFVEALAELGDYLRMPVNTYSAGMTARIGMAISLAVEFDCYLVDEGLDVSDSRFGRIMADRLKAAGLILVTHSSHQVRALCDRAAILEHGTLTFYDDLDEALATYNAL